VTTTEAAKRGFEDKQSQAAHERELADLRQNLRVKVGYDEARVDRLIEMERQKQPNASLRSLMEAAIEHWERNNR